MVPISFQQDALAVEPADDFQRLLMTFAGKLVEQGTPFHLAREAAQQFRQRRAERCLASSKSQRETRIAPVLEQSPRSSARWLVSLHPVRHRSHDWLELPKQDGADNKVRERRD